MQSAQFQLHARVEDSHWWFAGRRRIMRELIRQVLPAPGHPTVVDVGCGTGANIAAMAGDYTCVGIDPSREAIELARSRFPGTRFVCGRAPDDLGGVMPEARLVLLMDVLEHVPDDFAFLSELLAASTPGTHFLITVPANRSFWSEHDESNGHYRRYDPDRLRRVWAGLPVTTRLLSHFNARLYPVARAVRAWSRWRGRATGMAGTDLSLPRPPVNAALESIFAGEGRVLVDLLGGRRGRGYAAGVSLVALIRREAGEIVPRDKPDDVPPDLYDPATGRRFLIHGRETSRRMMLAPPPAQVAGKESVGRPRSGPDSARPGHHPRSVEVDARSRAIVVVPCYNEAKRLDRHALREFAREHPDPRFLFVNDGSTDGTREVLDELQREAPGRFLVSHLSRNAGKAEAVRQGLLRAFAEGAEYVGYWDADLATPLREILTFCSILDFRPEIDMVIGARVRLLGRAVGRNPLRHCLGRVFASAASLTLGLGIYDTQCGAKLFRASPELMSLFQAPFRTRWIFDVEILARLMAARRGTDRPRIDETIYEFPLHQWHDVAGSKVKPLDMVKAFFGLAAIRWRYGRTAGLQGHPRPSPIPGKPHAVKAPTPASISDAR
jgi:dolichyl-phosphate beta-glucosyltransferase